ncbi:type III secretion system translocon subunit SctE [Pseudomonadota bacterium AL_CKDN230030165-1A_HGKHYDSX7]
MDIRNTPNPGLTGGLDQPRQAGADMATAAMRAAGGIDLSALASQWAADVAQLRGEGGDGVSNANGKPAIAAPAKQFSASDMVDLLRNLQGKTQDAQLRSAKENIENNRIEQAKSNEEQSRKIDEWIQKSKEANKGGLLGKIFGWIGAIVAAIAAALMVVAAVAATAVTGGAAGPAMIALAAIAVTGAVSLLATQISSEVGGPEISISNMVTQAVSKLLQAFGVEPELAEKIGNIVAGASMLITGAILVEPGALGKMAGAIATVAGADPQTAGYIAMAIGLAATITVGVVMAVASFGAGTVSTAANVAGNITSQTMRTVADTAKTAGQVAQGAAAVAKGAGGIATGAESIQSAKAQEAADQVLADRKALEAMMTKLQASMEEDREKIKEVIQAMDEAMQLVSKMIAGAADSMTQITANIGKRAMV